MNDQLLQDTLTAHADSLNKGIDNTEWLLSRYQYLTPQRFEELADLLWLAGQVKSVLVPLYGREQFVAHLEDDLMEHRELDELMNGQDNLTVLEKHSWAWWGAAAAGSVLAGVAGLIVWRRVRPTDSAITAV